MNPRTYEYLSRPDLSEAEEAALFRELSDAYHMDEAAAASREVRHLVERVKSRIEELSKAAALPSQDVREPQEPGDLPGGKE